MEQLDNGKHFSHESVREDIRSHFNSSGTYRALFTSCKEEIELLGYILNKFGQKSAKEVYQAIEKVLNTMSEMPEIYPAYRKQKGLRKCVFSKQTSLYYRVETNYIEVVSFRSNQKNPDKFKS